MLPRAGEVEIELKHERVRLGAGHFFGEVAALRQARRYATVTRSRGQACLCSMPTICTCSWSGGRRCSKPIHFFNGDMLEEAEC